MNASPFRQFLMVLVAVCSVGELEVRAGKFECDSEFTVTAKTDIRMDGQKLQVAAGKVVDYGKPKPFKLVAAACLRGKQVVDDCKPGLARGCHYSLGEDQWVFLALSDARADGCQPTRKGFNCP